MELTAALNAIAGTTGLEAQGAANVIAGTTDRDLVAALNIVAGNTTYIELQGVLNQLAGSSGLGVNAAATRWHGAKKLDQAVAAVSGSIIRLDANHASSITSSAGSVSQWTDRVSAQAFVQGTGAYQPTTGTTQLNGRNVLNFARTSGTVGQWLAITGVASTAQPLTIFYVANLSGYDRTQGYNVFGSNGQVRSVYHSTSADAWSIFGASPVLSGGTSGNGLLLTTTILNGASSSARVNGTQVISGTTGTTGIATNAVVGAANTTGTINPWSGYVAEVIVYSGVLTGGQITSIESALQTKWGL